MRVHREDTTWPPAAGQQANITRLEHLLATCTDETLRRTYQAQLNKAYRIYNARRQEDTKLAHIPQPVAADVKVETMYQAPKMPLRAQGAGSHYLYVRSRV